MDVSKIIKATDPVEAIMQLRRDYDTLAKYGVAEGRPIELIKEAGAFLLEEIRDPFEEGQYIVGIYFVDLLKDLLEAIDS